MGKNIVICSDGTGNTTIKDRGTNVFKLYESVELNGATPQIAFYDDGVGSQEFKPLKIVGGAFGFGLEHNVKQLYANLVRSYVPGDKIFLFGFSRGAYTVRVLGGLITLCGVLEAGQFRHDADLLDAVDEAYAAYRKKYFRLSGAEATRGQRFHRVTGEQHEKMRQAIRHLHATRKMHPPVPIEFIGVWDTVAAYGFPIQELADAWNQLIVPFKFTDRKLNPLVQKACHALAMDEERKTFHPELWDESDEDRSKPPRIEQVWFAGVHTNVGGGYPQQGMSLVTLHWMMQRAGERGLRFNADDSSWWSGHLNINDRLYDSRAGAATIYRYFPRRIAELCKASAIEPKVHVSVVERIARITDGYAPGNFPPGSTLVATGAAAPAYLPALQAQLSQQLPAGATPFSAAAAWVEGGIRSHWAFIGCLVAALLVLGLANGLPNLLRFSMAADYAALVRNAAESRYWIALVLFVTGSVISYFNGRRCRRGAERVFTAYWKPMAATLRATMGI